MNIEEIRGEFTLFVLLEDKAKQERVGNIVAAAGYSATFFPAMSELFTAMQENVPHIIVFDLAAIGRDLRAFLQKASEFSTEIVLLATGPQSDFAEAKKYFLFGLYDFLVEFEGAEEKLVWNLDRACERLFYQYQNEQLLETLANQPQPAPASVALAAAEPALQEPSDRPAPAILADIEDESDLTAIAQGVLGRSQPGEFVDFSIFLEFLEEATRANNADELVNMLLHRLNEESAFSVKAIFFKYFPNQYSLIAKQMVGEDLNAHDGLGFKIDEIDSAKVTAIFDNIQDYSLLKDLMSAVGAPEFITFTLRLNNQIEGVVAVGAQDISVITPDTDIYFAAFRLAYARIFSESRLREFELIDSTTYVFNNRALEMFLNQEIARARRLELPVSFIRFDVDSSDELVKRYGEANFDVILRSVASVVKKSSRVNDIVARAKANHFCIIMPHTPKSGAAVRTERLRRMIESATFSMGGNENFRVTLSCGISEYPSLARDMEDLVSSAESALRMVLDRGGNKVCVATVPQGFQPDFTVKEV